MTSSSNEEQQNEYVLYRAMEEYKDMLNNKNIPTADKKYLSEMVYLLSITMQKFIKRAEGANIPKEDREDQDKHIVHLWAVMDFFLDILIQSMDGVSESNVRKNVGKNIPVEKVTEMLQNFKKTEQYRDITIDNCKGMINVLTDKIFERVKEYRKNGGEVIPR